MFHPTPHKNSAMVFWPVVMSLHRFLLTLLELNMSLLSTLNWWITNGILLDNSTDSSFFLLTPLDDTPYRRMGMFYQFEEFAAPALAHVVGSCSSHRTCCWFLFQPSQMLLVLASPLTVASCTLQMAGGNIGELRVKTRRTA